MHIESFIVSPSGKPATSLVPFALMKLKNPPKAPIQVTYSICGAHGTYCTCLAKVVYTPGVEFAQQNQPDMLAHSSQLGIHRALAGR